MAIRWGPVKASGWAIPKRNGGEPTAGRSIERNGAFSYPNILNMGDKCKAISHFKTTGPAVRLTVLDTRTWAPYPQMVFWQASFLVIHDQIWWYWYPNFRQTQIKFCGVCGTLYRISLKTFRCQDMMCWRIIKMLMDDFSDFPIHIYIDVTICIIYIHVILYIYKTLEGFVIYIYIHMYIYIQYMYLCQYRFVYIYTQSCTILSDIFQPTILDYVWLHVWIWLQVWANARPLLVRYPILFFLARFPFHSWLYHHFSAVFPVQLPFITWLVVSNIFNFP